MVKTIMKLTAFLTLVASLFGCAKPMVLDGDGSVYHESDYRTEYANILDYAFYDKDTLFAVAFLGYGEDGRIHRNNLVKSTFEGFADKVEHLDFEGDEWYLVVPRYKDAIEVTNPDTNEKHTVYHGEAFTVKCNLSDLHPNIRIGLTGSEHVFSPQISGEGRLVTNTDIHDITDYSVMDENLYVQEGE